MTYSAASSDPILDNIVDAIAEGVHPTRVILLGSRARGNARSDSDYDLAVEIRGETHPHDSWNACKAAIRDRGLNAAVDIFVRKTGQIERDRDDPGRMDWDIWREGIVIWPNSWVFLATGTQAPYEPRPALRVREGDSPAPTSLRDWLDRADEDLLTIDIALTGERIPWGAVAFHAQQAAEKYLKALLIERGIRPPHTHDLAELVAAARGAGIVFPELSTECAALAPYAVDVRYPERIGIPGEAVGRTVVVAGRLIVELCRARMTSAR